MGIQKLRSLLHTDIQKQVVETVFGQVVEFDHALATLEDLVDEISGQQDHGLIMTMGKGGVGKTIAAAAIAVDCCAAVAGGTHCGVVGKKRF